MMKKQLIILLLMLLLPVVAAAQEYVPAQKGNKWGVQRNGEWVIKPKYLSVTPFGDNFVVKVKGHKYSWRQEWDLISRDGTSLFTDKSQYNRFNIAVIQPDRAIVNNTKLINTAGEVLYDAWDSHRDTQLSLVEGTNLLATKRHSYDQHYSIVITHDRKELVPWAANSYDCSLRSIKIKGKEVVRLLGGERGVGLFDKDGGELLPMQGDYLDFFPSKIGEGYIEAKGMTKSALFDSDGNVVLSLAGICDFSPTRIPNLIVANYANKDRTYVSLLTGQKHDFTRQTGQRNRGITYSYNDEETFESLDADTYYIYNKETMHDSGRHLFPGTAYQWIVHGPAKSSTKMVGIYYDAVTGNMYNKNPLVADNSKPAKGKSVKGNSSATRPTAIKPQSKLLPNLNVVPGTLAFIDATGRNAVHANGSYKIRLQVKNTGKGAANDCTAKVTAKGSTNGIKNNRITVGSIPVGGTKTIEIPIASDMTTVDGQVEFAVQVDEPHGLGTDAQYITVNTRAFVAPLVQVTDYSITADGGQTLRKKETFDLQLMLQNTKQGRAENVNVTLTPPTGVFIVAGDEQRTFNQLAAGETKSLVYSLVVNNNYQGTTIPIQVNVKEKYGRYAQNRTITLKLDQAMASTKIAVDERRQEQKHIAIAQIGSDVDKDIPTGTQTQPNTFVVIIANEHYQMVDGVPFANNDGTMFKNYCRQTLGIPEKNIRLVKDATLNSMKFQIDWLSKVMQTYRGEASAIVYYAGHGIPDEQSHDSYLLPADGYAGNTSSGYSLKDLYRTLGALPAKTVTVFLDACFSGTKRDGTILASARGVAIKAKSSTPEGKMIVFSAAQGEETAYPYKEQQHGMFTYYLLKKLKDTKGDVTLGELSDYVTEKVTRQSLLDNSKSQTPTISVSATLNNGWREVRLK